MIENLEERFCSRISLQAGELLPGTASLAEVYFLLEYPGVWEAKALEGSTIPAEVKARLADIGRSFPASKTLLIKRQRHPGETGVYFFVAIVHDADPRLYSFCLPDYPSLLSLDIAGIVRGDGNFDGNLVLDPLLLICTNGRRDQCCARYGVPIYQALARLAGAAVWECSHVGGHRFAANLYHLPAGIMYGRLSEADAPALWKAIQAGEFLLDKLRGRTIYPPAAQAAEYYLRRQTGALGYTASRLLETTEIDPGQWRVRFATPDRREHEISVAIETRSDAVYESCALDKQTTLAAYHQVEV